MGRGLVGISYAGGKSAISNGGTGRWVASMLPTDNLLYCEPFAGMLGVLLQREPSPAEIVNDLNSWIVRWWEGVRDYPEQLVDLLIATPVSRELYEKYDWIVKNESAYDYEQPEAAWIFSIALAQNIRGKLTTKGWWCNTTERTYKWDALPERIVPLAKRLHGVQLENRDALEVIEVYGKHEHALLYLDPPYRGGEYCYEHDVDVEAMFDLIKDLPCRVAISGYENCPWSELDWYENTRKVQTTMSVMRMRNVDGDLDRTEFLWTNFEPNLGQQPLFGV